MNTVSANTLQNSPAGVFVLDVRTPAEFEEFHVTGARNIPLDRLRPDELERLVGGKSAPIYLLCRSGGRAKKAGEMLESAGFTNLHCVTGGSVACQEAGVTMTTGGRKVISLERQVRIAAGTLVLTGVVLGFAVSPGWFALSGFVGIGLVFAGITDWCGMAMVLSRAPWNR